MITLKQIAVAAGVHSTTASTILNAAGGNTRVGEATRKRVVAAARRMGYIRNESARRLRTGKANAVGFIGGDLRNPFFSELAAALERELRLHDLQLVLSHVAPTQSSTFSQMAEVFHQQMINRVIYWNESASALAPEASARSQLFPIGFTLRPQPGVWLDISHAIRAAVSYLIEHRHRRICFYAPAGKMESPSVTIRRRIFLDECRRRSLPSPVCASYDGESWDIESAAAGARDLLRRKCVADAFVGFNDVASLGVLLATATLRFKPLVLCFDGTSFARSWPTRPPAFDMKIPALARTAVAVATGLANPAITGRMDRWLRPELIDGTRQNSHE